MKLYLSKCGFGLDSSPPDSCVDCSYPFGGVRSSLTMYFYSQHMFSCVFLYALIAAVYCMS